MSGATSKGHWVGQRQLELQAGMTQGRERRITVVGQVTAFPTCELAIR